MPSTSGSGTYSQGYNGQLGMNIGTEPQLSQSKLEDVQQQLQQQGFYQAGKVDGRWGPQTRQAVLQATGQLDQQTLAALGVNKQGG
jgi:peptidoglycan hydrolase-like protein with peptidoglycan-binding domain